MRGSHPSVEVRRSKSVPDTIHKEGVPFSFFPARVVAGCFFENSRCVLVTTMIEGFFPCCPHFFLPGEVDARQEQEVPETGLFLLR